MEKTEITLEPFTAFRLKKSELKKFYLSMALIQYHYLCVPDYNEKRALKLICTELKKNLMVIQGLIEQFPNNHDLNRAYNFFNTHYSILLKILRKEKDDSEITE